MSIPLNQAMLISASGWQKIISESCSLEKALTFCTSDEQPEARSVVQSLLYTTVRHRAQVEYLVRKLVKKEPQEKVRSLLCVALALLLEDKEKPFTVVNQAVEAAKTDSDLSWSSGFFNAVLRNFLRNRSQLTSAFKTDLSTRYNAPGWWISKIKRAYPKCWQSILSTQNKRPPLTLRINRAKTTVDEFLKTLSDHGFQAKQIGPWAVVIEPACPVNKIPGFFEGLCSVQDAGSQLVTELLELKDGDRVLDACAAPGGKTAQLLETHRLDVTAMEIDPDRAVRINETLSRLGLAAKIVVGDASDESVLGRLGDVRRHPDIVWSRRPEDIDVLASRQAHLLETLWKKVPQGKQLLYVVCSIFPEEGPMQIQRFLENHPEASLKPNALSSDGMLRLVPTENERIKGLPINHDGFFYALLVKGNKQ